MNKEEIKIITLGDIFRNLETEEQAFEFLKYIKNIQQENERLKDNAIHNDKVVDKARWNEMIYKSRVEKAVEYIRSNEWAKDYEISNCRTHLLNILQN